MSILGGFQIAFSPRDEWVVARAGFRPFYTWRLRESGVVQPQPLFDTESNRGMSAIGVDFSPDGKWAAGLAQNGAVYVWLLDKPPSGIVEPALPKGKGSPWLSFSPRGELLAGCTIDGGVYIWKPGETPNVLDPAARHDADYVTLVWGVEGRHLFTYGGSDVYWGEVTDKLQHVVREKSPVVGIAVPGDRRQLVVLGENHVSIMERRFYFWGVPVYTQPWPALAPREGRGSEGD
jgi:WD40 repeat protein